jgi:transposase
MTTSVRYVGMDVHKESITLAVAEDGREPAKEYCTVPNDMTHLLKALRQLGAIGKLRCCYEAGPTGYELFRGLKKVGIDCCVVAPSLVPIQAGNRVKTDRRDAVKLAHFFRSGDLTAVYVPDEATEALRDLERARDDAKGAERNARHQLGKFLLRHGRQWSETGWTQAHLKWIRGQKFAHEAQQRVLTDYVKAVEDATARVDALSQDLAELVETTALAPLVKALQAFRGIRLVTAVTIAAELGDLRRFDTPRQLMAFLGLVPSEHSSGESQRRGRITRTGNTHVRRVLVEAAWSYRFRPNLSQELRQRNQGVAAGVQRIAWQAQQRLHKRLFALQSKGKSTQKAITAVARELAGFIWAVGQEENLLVHAA